MDERVRSAGVVAIEEALRRSSAVRRPVCRIVDPGKLRFDAWLRVRQGLPPVAAEHLAGAGRARPGRRKPTTIRIRPAIDEHDLRSRIAVLRRLLDAGHRVEVVCGFRGRQPAFPERGYEVLRRTAEALEDVAEIDRPPRLHGSRMAMLLVPRA